MKKLLNNPERAIEEMTEGILAAHRDVLRRSARHPRALVRAERADGKAAVIIGGGSGHEPAFLGYVGSGLADGVALGNFFASPPPDPIVAAARDSETGAGILLVYGNYSGDVMNFEMAAELLATEGIPVESLVIADDVGSAIYEERSSRRGIAGEVLAYKILGAAADQGYALSPLVGLGRQAMENCRSIGVAWTPCTLPTTGVESFALAEGEMELGIGVHGEPGVQRIAMGSADQIAEITLTTVLDDFPIAPRRVALLINGLGSTSLMELYVYLRAVMARLEKYRIEVGWVRVGELITSQEMGGCSLTMLDVDDNLLDLLRAPCYGLGWRQGC